jgi:DNA-binding MarR family transcriptional regulator/GNAT superfamily N-acetyltransferase
MTEAQHVDAIRQFNRFYTQQIGLLQEHLLESGHSLTEARLLFEIGAAKSITAAQLSDTLALHPGYLSRVLGRFDTRGLIERKRSALDGRAVEISLTRSGRAELKAADEAASVDVRRMLGTLGAPGQEALVEAMASIRALLSGGERTYTLRDPRPGDMGWIVHKQAALYAREYGWNGEYEALTAEIVASFIRQFNPNDERCWVAEADGQVIGSIFVVREDDTTAKLRLLYVDAAARGMGVGTRLVDECLRFARQVGYKRMVLWTSSVLVDAIRLYEKAGFVLEGEERAHKFGKELTFRVYGRSLD